MSSDIIIDLNNPANWIFRGSRTKNATVIKDGSKDKYLPIPSFELGITTNDRFLAVVVFTKYSRSTWQHGGFINQLYPVSLSGSTKAMTEGKVLLLNQVKIVTFPRYSGLSYKLFYSPKSWFRDVTIKVWQYRGEEFDFTTDTLNRLEQKIDQIITY